MGFGVDRYSLLVPTWFPAAVFAVLPAVFFAKSRRGRVAQFVGLWPSCGYDLRATPERCPECGREAAMAVGN
jgi:hypothetical protein